MKYVVMLLLAFMNKFSFAESIASVMLRNNSEYMARLDYVDQAYSPKTVQAYNRVLRKVSPARLLFLRVIDTNQLFGISSGNTIIVDMYLERLDQTTREFIIAHEMGHLILNHDRLKLDMYNKHKSQHDITNLSRQCEIDADTFALKTLIKLGWTRTQVVKAFEKIRRIPESATHPSSEKRIKNLLNVQI